MSETLITGPSQGTSPIWHDASISGMKRYEQHAGMPVVLLNHQDILQPVITVSGLTISGIALDVSVDELEDISYAISGAVDGLEGITTSILSAVDELETMSSGILDAVDGIEGLITTSNTTLSGIETAVDGLEALQTAGNNLLTAISGNTDNLETLETAGNNLLIAISGHTDNLETLTIAGNDLLTAISGNTDNLETLITTSNTRLSGIEIAVDGLEALQTAGNNLLTAISGNTDNLETLQIANNDLLTAISGNTDNLESLITISNTRLSGIETAVASSGNIITDPDGSTQARVLSNTAVPSGDIEALAITVDTKLEVSTVLASGSITGGIESSDIDVSNQLGFYNNAIFIISSATTTINVLANSDGGANFATVAETLSVNANEAIYYSLKGYETTMRIKPTDTGDFIVKLIRNR